MKIPSIRPLARRRAGALIEVVVSTIIVATLVVAALESVGMVYRSRRMSVDMLTGVGLARELMAEILAMPYEDPENPGGAIGVDAGESAANRTTFDDVDDYHGLDNSDARGRAAAAANYGGWRQQVTVSRAQLADPSAISGSESGLKCVTVIVSSPTGKQSQLKSLRSTYGVVQQTLPIAAEAITWVGVELQLGTSTRNEHAATAIANHADEAN